MRSGELAPVGGSNGIVKAEEISIRDEPGTPK
jgi:hypothetical protein